MIIQRQKLANRITMRKFKTAEASEGGAFIAQSNKRGKSSENTEQGAVKSPGMESALAPTPDDVLLDRLNNVKRLYELVADRFYKGGDLYGPYPESKPVHTTYETVYGDGAVKPTKADVELFIKKVDKVDGNSLNLEYPDEDRVNKLRAFFALHGADIVETLQSTAHEYMDMYDLSVLDKKITADHNSITINMRSKQVTDVDIQNFNTLQNEMKDFKKVYEESQHPKVKTTYKSQYDFCVNQINTAAATLSKLEELKGKYSKKLAADVTNSALPQESQALQSPEIGISTYHYIPKGSKSGSENEDNQRSLKNKGMYSESTETYSIYKKGKGDTHEVAMNDAKQGFLGDCYLISSIASVAMANPDYIKKLISYDEKKATVTVTLHILDHGVRKPKPIEVDFYFPMATEPSSFDANATVEKEAFARRGDNELWVMLIEKAYAKELGGYANIEGGDPSEALSVLTGQNTVDTDMEKMTTDEMLLNELTAVLTNTDPAIRNKAVIAGTKSVVTNNKLESDHAYSVIKADKNGVEIRNPHFNAEKDGLLTISLKDFRDNFTSFKVSEVPK